MSMVFISFMYGMAIPMMFPITLVGIFSIYINERLLLAYSYQKPVAIDDKLEKISYAWYQFAPIVMFLYGYWFIGNR